MGVGAGACRMLGTAPLEVAAFAFVLKGRGESLQSPGSGANSIAKGRGSGAAGAGEGSHLTSLANLIPRGRGQVPPSERAL